MKILLVHNNFPGQFKYLIHRLLAELSNEVVVFTMNDFQGGERLKVVRYQAAKGTSRDVHPWVADIETKVIRGEAAFLAACQLRDSGFVPDVIFAHPGWGESLFLKDVWPLSKLLIYCEFHYSPEGRDVGFDPEFPIKKDSTACRIRMKNVNNLMHFDMADGGISPTNWQRSTFPEPFRSKIEVVHDGVDTELLKPDPKAALRINDQEISAKQEVITFVNRNLEPYRGYHIFMRALPALMKLRPKAKFLIVGGNGVSYGAAAPEGKTWKQVFLDEVKEDLDLSRAYFLGNISHNHFIKLLQLSTVHVYLTYPFVLSWSLLEAMSCGCAIVASDTEPVREVIEHGKTGMLVPFFDAERLARQVADLADDSSLRKKLSKAARRFARDNYDLETVCLPRLEQIVYRYAPLSHKRCPQRLI